MNKLFENSGDKLKSFAKVCFVLGIIGTFVLAFVFGSDEGGLFFGIIIVGSVLSYLQSLLLFGFGELIGNTKNSGEVNVSSIGRNSTSASVSHTPSTTVKMDYKNIGSAPAKTQNGYICTKCGNALTQGQTSCKTCGKIFDWNKL